jgi:hypothetical protein
MAGESSLFSRYFSSYEPVEQITARPGENAMTSSYRILGFKRKLNLWKNHVVEGNLECFYCCWDLKMKQDVSKSLVLLKTSLKNCRTNLNIIFPPFQRKCMTE